MIYSKGYLLIILILLIVVSSVAVKHFYSPKIKQDHLVTQATPLPTDQVKVPYKYGTELDNAKLSVETTSNWQMFYEVNNDKRSSDSLTFFKRISIYVKPIYEVIPSGANFWGGIVIDLYQPQPSIESWFTEFLKTPIYQDNSFNQRNYYMYATSQLGNKTAYLIQPSQAAPTLVKDTFRAREIILGKYYVYQISFFENGSRGFASRISEEIFPHINFQ